MINCQIFDTIGLYGDSFTDGRCDNITGEVRTNNDRSYTYHWSSLLKKELGCDIINYGAGSSSLYYSYKRFVKYHNQHKTNIFLVTAPGRYTKPVKLVDRDILATGMLSLLARKKHDFVDPSYANLWGFFFCQDIEFESFCHNLIVKKILEINPNVILVPCYSTSLDSEYREKNNINFDLSTFVFESLEENQLFCQDYTLFDENWEIFSGHMLPEHSRVVADNVKYRLLNGVWDWQNPKIQLNYKWHSLWRKR